MSETPQNLGRDFLAFLGESKGWWIVPLIVLLALLIWLAASTPQPAPPPTYPDVGWSGRSERPLLST